MVEREGLPLTCATKRGPLYLSLLILLILTDLLDDRYWRLEHLLRARYGHTDGQIWMSKLSIDGAIVDRSTAALNMVWVLRRAAGLRTRLALSMGERTMRINAELTYTPRHS